MKFLEIPTGSRDITDCIYSHLLTWNLVKSALNRINYHTFILVQCVSLSIIREFRFVASRLLFYVL